MVEMIEAASILRSATSRSLVVLDEIGRGTSTFDGMAIAQSIAEDLHDVERPSGAPKTIFATHYHELTALADRLPRLRTYRLDVLERGDDVVFLHTVVEGGADRSYGVHVARLAGVPERVTRRAALLLRDLETSSPAPASEAAPVPPCSGACTELIALDILALTPLQAQAELFRLQQLAQHHPAAAASAAPSSAVQPPPAARPPTDAAATAAKPRRPAPASKTLPADSPGGTDKP
jgi:DNA mismatch repair protein MutS